MVAADEVDLGGADERPDGRRLQVRESVVVGGRQVRHHAAVVARDDDAAPAGRVGGRDVVFGADAGGGAGGAERRGVGVRADGADVQGAVRGEQVLVPRRGVRMAGVGGGDAWMGKGVGVGNAWMGKGVGGRRVG